jgi:hypothetical protein
MQIYKKWLNVTARNSQCSIGFIMHIGTFVVYCEQIHKSTYNYQTKNHNFVIKCNKCIINFRVTFIIKVFFLADFRR